MNGMNSFHQATATRTPGTASFVCASLIGTALAVSFSLIRLPVLSLILALGILLSGLTVTE